MTILYTWGYSKRTQADLGKIITGHRDVWHYEAAPPDMVVDVRRYTASRWKPEFSDNELWAFLEWRYLRLSEELGNYHKALPWKRGPLWMRGVCEVYHQLKSYSVLLLCLEQNPTECHRSEVADVIAEVAGCDVVHLGWEETKKAPQQEEMF